MQAVIYEGNLLAANRRATVIPPNCPTKQIANYSIAEVLVLFPGMAWRIGYRAYSPAAEDFLMVLWSRVPSVLDTYVGLKFWLNSGQCSKFTRD